MQVSFIIPLHGCLPLTQAMLASFVPSLPPGLAYEVILVDDCSTDGTREWLATLHDPRVRVVLNEKNLGYGASNNRGAALATGEFLALLNNDLVLAPGWLEPILRAHRWLGGLAGLVGNVQLNARTGALDHAGIYITARGKPAHFRSLPRFSRFFTGLRRVPALTGACVVLRRSRWEQLGGFDPQFINGAEDIDLCFRAAELGLVHAVALRSVVRHHVSASPGRKLRDEENSFRLARKWRETLARSAHGFHRRWCREFLVRYARDPHNAALLPLARQALGYLARLRREPPEPALETMRLAIRREFSRWETLLR